MQEAGSRKQDSISCTVRTVRTSTPRRGVRPASARGRGWIDRRAADRSARARGTAVHARRRRRAPRAPPACVQVGSAQRLVRRALRPCHKTFRMACSSRAFAARLLLLAVHVHVHTTGASALPAGKPKKPNDLMSREVDVNSSAAVGVPACPSWTSMTVNSNSATVIDFTGTYANDMDCRKVTPCPRPASCLLGGIDSWSCAFLSNRRWGLTCADSSPGQTMTLSFTAFQTESGYDYVKVYDGHTSADVQTSNRIESWSGSKTEYPSLNLTKPQLVLQFTSDPSNVMDGFRAEVACPATTTCGDELDALCGNVGGTACIMCAGVHAATLRETGCSNDDIQSWCVSHVPGYHEISGIAWNTDGTNMYECDPSADEGSWNGGGPGSWSGGGPGVISGVTPETAAAICNDDIAGTDCWGFSYSLADHRAYLKSVMSDAPTTLAFVSNRSRSERVNGTDSFFVQRGVAFATKLVQTVPNMLSTTDCAEKCTANAPSSANLVVGDRVKVKDSVDSPACGWGSITHSDCGTVMDVGTSGTCPITVDFTKQKGWSGAASDFELCSGENHGNSGCDVFVMRGTTCELRVWETDPTMDTYIKGMYL
jgi:hypothetical protein